jgi:hypothetical protein
VTPATANFEPGELLGRMVEVVVVQEPGVNDPSKMFSVVSGFRPAANGAGATAPARSPADDDIPF